MHATERSRAKERSIGPSSAERAVEMHRSRDGLVQSASHLPPMPHFRAERTEVPDPAGADTRTVTLSVVAEADGGAVLWRQPLRTLWSKKYAPVEWEETRGDAFTVERMSVTTLADGTSALFVRASDGTVDMLDPRDGEPMRERLWAKLGSLPGVPAQFTVKAAERIAIAAVPGYATLLHLQNAGPRVLLEPSYRRLKLESARGGAWRTVAEQRHAAASLQALERGGDVDVFVSATLAHEVRKAGGQFFRATFLVYALGDDGVPTSAARAEVLVPPRELAVLLQP